ncbi:MAG: hypothetical protein ACR2LX_15795 [Jatrophihabitans sp.]
MRRIGVVALALLGLVVVARASRPVGGRPPEATVSSNVLISVVPLRGAFDATDVLPHAAGMVGSHRSHHPGDGSLRRIARGQERGSVGELLARLVGVVGL